jgi:hypothetical protein
MKLKLKCAISIRPDRKGEYPEEIAKRLIAYGIAEPLETASIKTNERRARSQKES